MSISSPSGLGEESLEFTGEESVVSSSAGAASACSSGGVAIIRGGLLLLVMLGEGMVTKEDRLPWTANPPASEGNSMHSESFMGGVL